MVDHPTIWKFQLRRPGIGSQFEVRMPQGSRPISAGFTPSSAPNGGDFTVWAIVPVTSAPARRHAFWIAPTGHPLPAPVTERPCLGRVEVHDGALIFHVFDLGEEAP